LEIYDIALELPSLRNYYYFLSISRWQRGSASGAIRYCCLSVCLSYRFGSISKVII